MQNALVPFDNQNLFDDRGHLTGAGLNAMESGSLDELGSLEAAEHLSFCDACLNRYTNWLEAMPQALLSPARDIAPQVQNLLRMRSIRVFTNKYVSIAAAVILAFVLWNFGAFNISTGAAQRGVDRLAEGPRFSISQSIQQFIGGIGKGIDDVLSDTALLLDYIVTCKEAGIISTKTAGIWSGKATDVKRMAAAWRKSSSQRAEAILREKQEAADRHTAEIVAKVAAETVRKALAEERAEVF